MKTTKMKALALLLIFTGVFTAKSTMANELKTLSMNDRKAIEKTVKTYISGGDQQSIEILQTVMHDNYRVLINDLKENVIKELDKSTYLDFIGKKVFGGDPRQFEIETIEVSNQLNACVKLKMNSSKATFYSQFSLVKVNGKWWIIQDLVYMEAK